MITTTDIAGLLRYAQNELQNTDQNAVLDAQVLLAHILNKPRSWLLAHSDHSPEPQLAHRYKEYIAKLNEGMPLAYLTGRREFFGLTYQVTPDVLIPRPETELMVEQALKWLKHQPEVTQAIDIGTGSGCIASALAKNCPHLSIIAVDISLKALFVAAGNFKDHGISHLVHPVCGNLFSCLSGSFNLICANLPYIPSPDLGNLQVSRFEPHLALDGGSDGLELINQLLTDSSRWLISPGLLLLEVHEKLSAEVQNLAAHLFPSADIQLIHDYAGRPRLSRIEI